MQRKHHERTLRAFHAQIGKMRESEPNWTDAKLASHFAFQQGVGGISGNEMKPGYPASRTQSRPSFFAW